MNINLLTTTARQYAMEVFNRQQTQARRGYLLSRIFARQATLASFSDYQSLTGPNRSFLGLRDIPVEQIIGSVSRASDYDPTFRPLKKNLRDRWVLNYLSLQTDGWAPILVYKVCDEYFVEDGHHRVSVARYTGMAFIQAEVWEFALVRPPARERSRFHQRCVQIASDATA
jgi:hypothetical protein